MTAPKNSSPSVVVELAMTKDTPNTVRYDEVKDDTQPSQVRTVYVQKHVAAGLGNPVRIIVTIAPST